MHKSRFKLFSAVHLILVRDDQVLLMRRFNTGYEDGNYSLPAGHLDGNESASNAMAREAREEVGLNLDLDALDVVHVMHRLASNTSPPTNERVDFFLRASVWNGEPQIMEPDKCDELSWHSLDALPSNTIPYIRAALDMCRRGEYYSEYGWSDLTRGGDFELARS